MIEVGQDERAGAAATALGPDVAKALSPATPDTSDSQPLLDESPEDEGPVIDGAELLDAIQAFCCRFIGYPSYMDSIAHALWIGHTHLMGSWFSTPRLAVLSPEPGSGKSRVLEITGLFVPNPVLSVSSTAAYIMRKIADQENRPTILYDEIDNVLGKNARGNGELLATLNAGYRKGATTGRVKKVKDDLIPVEFPTYAAVALSGLDTLPDTIMSRSVIMRMQRQPEGETVEPFQPYDHAASADTLYEGLAAWAASVASKAEAYRPELPDGIVNRNADIWRPLIAVADLAGDRWPGLARQAAMAAVKAAKANNKPSPGVQLLTDIRLCLAGKDGLPTANLVQELNADEEAPWGGLGRKGLDARILGEMLRDYGIKSKTYRFGGPGTAQQRGYLRKDFESAWARYLPSLSPAVTGVTSVTDQEYFDKTEDYDSADDAGPPGM